MDDKLTPETALKPCPFCGCEPAISNYARNWYGCSNANCPASVVNTSAKTWNTRAEPKPCADAVECAQKVIAYWEGPGNKQMVDAVAIIQQFADAQDAKHEALATKMAICLLEAYGIVIGADKPEVAKRIANALAEYEKEKGKCGLMSTGGLNGQSNLHKD